MDNAKLYIGNLAWSVTSETLKSFFEQAGVVKDATVILDRETGRSRGFGFVTMETPEGSQKALQSLEGVHLNGRPLMIRQALPEGERHIRFEGKLGGDPNNPFKERNKILVECPNCGHKF